MRCRCLPSVCWWCTMTWTCPQPRREGEASLAPLLRAARALCALPPSALPLFLLPYFATCACPQALPALASRSSSTNALLPCLPCSFSCCGVPRCPWMQVRLRAKGGHGGHNGMKSIVSHLQVRCPSPALPCCFQLCRIAAHAATDDGRKGRLRDAVDASDLQLLPCEGGQGSLLTLRTACAAAAAATACCRAARISRG